MELHQTQDCPTKILVDNKSALELAKNPMFHERSKHIDTKYHFIRECVSKKEIELEYVKSQDQVADIFTKPLKIDVFHKLRIHLGEQLFNNDTTGRVLKYDPMTKQATVLLGGLAGATGVTLSQDGSFLLATEYFTGNIYKYWLKGPKAATAEVIMNLEGYANKIRATTRGDFWVGVIIEGPPHTLLGQRIDEYGTVLETLTFSPEFNSPLISEVYEFNDALFLGSLNGEYVGVYKA
ncbi:hypothetical protein RJ639_028942 [Escallonia herrerae]|uniref:Strictosidine synthase conserved region domain-containing protein n=1 Tax=Escallonia herrerae TaxID=1293975 RepID=A0AA89BFD0_9ASTE|nr:hypothetical protein RJ639_028941 [Escallonia herrerae]KAK3040230.1 hypothetical protein RJ639_028942 [Escallonia herrerae]